MKKASEAVIPMRGRVTQEELEKLDPRTRAVAEERSIAVREQMSPPGALGLPPALEACRLGYGIIDAHFATHAVFEKVLVWQPPVSYTSVGSGLVALTDDSTQAEQLAAPHGIVISAGLKAMDVLRHHGIALGDMVTFTRGVVTRIRAGWLGGKQQWTTVLYADDISGSEDLPGRLARGEIELKRDEKGSHYYVWNGEPMPAPGLPTNNPNV